MKRDLSIRKYRRASLRNRTWCSAMDQAMVCNGWKCNAVFNRPYSGCNVLLLLMAQAAGYRALHYLTYLFGGPSQVRSHRRSSRGLVALQARKSLSKGNPACRPAVLRPKGGGPVMTRMLLCGAAALVLLTLPAAAQANSKTIDPLELTKQVKGPPAQLSNQQEDAIQNGLVAVHTQQKAPPDFKPQAGQPLPKGLKVDTMPDDIIRGQPSLKEYGYAKTATDILVLDPLNKKIVAVIPRKFPGDAYAKPVTPADWADKHARELTGQAPKSASRKDDPSPESPGDAAAVGNGRAEGGEPQDSGVQPGYQDKH
jgi:hypothetical protein